MLKLLPELVPESAWCKNLRSELPRADWDKVRKAAYKKADCRCEICGGVGRRHPVECHEVWDYDEKTAIQRLKKVEAICPACHEVKHIGLAQIKGRYKQALAHMCKVNGIAEAQAVKIVLGAKEQWCRRSGMRWQCDMTALDEIMKNA